MLFGLSMDYEVFLVTRMREAGTDGADNATAVAHGLERTGRIITAAAVIMCAAFSGFVAGRIVGLQEFGLGLAVAIFLDATIVRSLLVPSMMALLGRWNWWLPAWARGSSGWPSPLEPQPRPRGAGPHPARAGVAVATSCGSPRAPHLGARSSIRLGDTLSEHAGNESAIGGCDHLCMRYLAAIIGDVRHGRAAAAALT